MKEVVMWHPDRPCPPWRAVMTREALKGSWE